MAAIDWVPEKLDVTICAYCITGCVGCVQIRFQNIFTDVKNVFVLQYSLATEQVQHDFDKADWTEKSEKFNSVCEEVEILPLLRRP